jgi:hypothetical protein
VEHLGKTENGRREPMHTMKVGKERESEPEARKMLEKQLQLLFQRSQSGIPDAQLAKLSREMVRIASYIDRDAIAIRPADENQKTAKTENNWGPISNEDIAKLDTLHETIGFLNRHKKTHQTIEVDKILNFIVWALKTNLDTLNSFDDERAEEMEESE